MHILFTGNFKELIPMGFKFSKLHDSKQIYYRKDDVFIWKKENEVEIDEFGGYSYLILQYLIDHNFKIKNEHNFVIVNTKTKQIEEYKRESHEALFFMDKLSDEEMSEFFKTYLKIRVREETIKVVKELHESGLISVKE